MAVHISSLSTVTIVILYISLLQYNFGNFIFYDATAILAVQLTNDVGLTPTQVQFLTTIYAIPNIILPLFCGSFVDLFGLELSQMIGNTVIGISFIAFSYGIYLKSWSVILFGRFLFALSAEYNVIVQLVLSNNIVSKNWVSQHFAFISFLENISIFVNSLMCSIVYENSGTIGDTFYYVTLVELFSVFQGYLFLAIRYRVDLNLYTCDNTDEKQAEKKQNYNMLNALNFRAEFFFVLLTQLFVCGVIFTFSTISASMFQNTFGLSQGESGYINSFLGILSIFSQPIVGFFSKKFNKKAYISIVCVLMTLTSIGSMLLYQNLRVLYFKSETLIMLGQSLEIIFGDKRTYLLCATALLGVGYSLFACVKNEMIFQVVQEEYHGLAMGTMSVCSSIGIWGFSSLIERINKDASDESYFQILMLYFIGLCFGLVFTLLNLFKNYTTDCCHIYSHKYLEKVEDIQKSNTEELEMINNGTDQKETKKMK